MLNCVSLRRGAYLWYFGIGSQVLEETDSGSWFKNYTLCIGSGYSRTGSSVF